jgi:hypothetical protein
MEDGSLIPLLSEVGGMLISILIIIIPILILL